MKRTNKIKFVSSLSSLVIASSAFSFATTACSNVNKTNSNSNDQIGEPQNITTFDWIQRSVLPTDDVEKIVNYVLSDNGIVFAQHRDLRPCLDVTVTEISRVPEGELTVVTFTIAIGIKDGYSSKYTGSVTWNAVYTYTTPIPPTPEEKVVINTGVPANLNFYDVEDKQGTITVSKGDTSLPLTNLTVTVEGEEFVTVDWNPSVEENNITLTPHKIGFAKISIVYAEDGVTLASVDLPISVTVDDVTPITYETALSYMSDGKLVPDKKYQITDYKATVNSDVAEKGISASALGQFDLMLTAASTSKFYDDCYAVKHALDVYYINTNLEAWNIMYDINNDTSKYEWADDSLDGEGKHKGKGVIYSLTDEHSNTTSYDFKGIKFNGKYTFNGARNEDASLTNQAVGNNIASCVNESRAYYLNNIVFNLGETGKAWNNSFETGCTNITLGANCSGNSFETNCYDITLDNESSSNTFGNGCNFINATQQGTNTVKKGFYGNTFEDYCSGIDFNIAKWDGTPGTQKYVIYNLFYPGISGVTVSNIQFSNNTIHPGVQNITFRNENILDKDIYPTEDIISWSDPISVEGTDIEIVGDEISYYKVNQNGQFKIEASDEILSVNASNALTWSIDVYKDNVWKPDSKISASLAADNKTLTVTIDKTHDDCSKIPLRIKCNGASKTVNDFTTKLNVSVAQNTITASGTTYDLANNIDPSLFCCPDNENANREITLPLSPTGSRTFDVTTISDIHLESFDSTKTTIGDSFIENFTNLTSLQLLNMDKVESIGNLAISNNQFLTDVDISGLTNVTSLGALFMSSCVMLQTLDLTPLAKVKNIGNAFLAYCTNLTYTDLSPMVSVETVGNNFMSFCSSLINVDLTPLHNITSVGNGFFQASGLLSIDFGPLTNVVEIGDNFLSGCRWLTTLDLSPLTNVETIGDYFLGPNTIMNFDGCINLTSIDLSGFTKLRTIGDSFLGATGTIAGTGAQMHYEIDHEGCKSLKQVDLSAFTNVTTIGEKFMFGCKALTSIDLTPLAGSDPEDSWSGGVQIGQSMLSECYNLLSINFGSLAASQIARSESPIALPQPFAVCDKTSAAAADGITPFGSYLVGEAGDMHYIRAKFGSTNNALGWVRIWDSGQTNKMTYNGKMYELDDDIDPNSFISTSEDGWRYVSQDIKLKNGSYMTINGDSYSWSLLTSLSLVNSDRLSANTIRDFFLYKCINLKALDISGLINVSQILSGFCSYTALSRIDLNSISQLYNLGLYFMMGCESLRQVLLKGITRLTMIGDYFLAGCVNLAEASLPNQSIKNVEWWYGKYDNFMSGIPMSTDIQHQGVGPQLYAGDWGSPTVQGGYISVAPWGYRGLDIVNWYPSWL